MWGALAPGRSPSAAKRIDARERPHRISLRSPRPFGITLISPLLRINTRPHVFVKGGMRPIPHPRYVVMFDRVVMNVLDMPREIDFVADLMFPEPPLPQCAFAAFGTGRAAG